MKQNRIARSFVALAAVLSLVLLAVSVMQTSASSAGAITFAPAPKELAAPDVALQIVNVGAPAINCIFDLDCTITVNDFSDTFAVPGAAGLGTLVSRQWPIGEAGTKGEGLYPYLYRIDLGQAAATTAVVCVDSLDIDFGGPVEKLDYDGNNEVEDVFVVTSGGVGSIAPVLAEQTGTGIRFTFKPAVCPAGSNTGSDTFYFGLASKQPPQDIVATVNNGSSVIANPKARAPERAPVCNIMQSSTEIPSAGLINFDDLSEADTIGAHYQPTHGVSFEDSATMRAIIYNQSLHPTEPTEPNSKPNYAINNAVFPSTSSGVPMLIKFDAPKTHVGLYMGNGESGGILGVLRAFDAAGNEICIARSDVPEDVVQFIGVHDSGGRIASITLDYGDTTVTEAIDDLYFAPYTPATATPTPTVAADTPTATPVTPTNTPVTPTNTPVTPTNTPSPTPTSTSIVANPVIAAPYFPIKQVVALPPIFKPDLSIHGIEITQGIQCFDNSKGLASCPDNSLPVAAKKDTTARIYLKYSGFLSSSMSNVPVRLHIFANGVEYIANASGKATTSINQGNSDSADIYFNVNFSNDVVVSYYAEVDPNNTIAETNESNNRYPASGTKSMTFRKRTTLDIVGQRLRYHPSGYTGTQYAGGWAVNGGGADFMEQMLPIRNNGIDYSLKSGYLNWTTSLGSGDGQHALIQYLNSQWIMQNALSWLFGTGAFTGAEHVYGWAPNSGYSGGHADMPVYPHAGGLGVVGIGTDRPGASTDNPGGGALIMAHELIHDYDVKHTNTADACGSNDSSSSFPYGSSSIQEFGFNPITGKIYDPATTHDVMSYCPAGGSKQGWVSPFTWNYMSSRLDAVVSAASLDRMGVRLGTQNMQAGAADKSLVVNAAIYNPAAPDYDPNHPGDLYNLHQIDAGLEYPLPGEGYAIELRKDAEILYTEAFSISFQSEYHDGHSGNNDDPPFPAADTLQADVSLIMPWIDGTTDVVLLKGEQVLATQKVSANAPTVNITSPSEATSWPAGSTQMVTWTGDDADGDSLTYTILYSFNNGESWDLLETGLVTPTYEVPVDAFAGSDSAVFRVVATDGVNMGYAESAPVSIPNKAPEAIITNPVDGSTASLGNLVVLQGSALDLEDGRLDDSVLSWSSDKQGALGTGPSVAVNNLQLGAHVITLTATDSNGNTGSASVTITIENQVTSAQTTGNYLFLPITLK
ncbi:MAG: hypothetical protein R3A44_04830 [Caldilineaceae bacterium]